MPVNDIQIHSVAACCNGRGIGKNGRLPWHLPREYQHFTQLTVGKPPEGKQNAVVMGRKTWESTSPTCHPLKNRYNFVLSHSPDVKCEGADGVVSSLEDLVNLLKSNKWKDRVHEVFNTGGTTIYKLVQESSHCGNIYLTRVYADFECDTFFPELGNEFISLPIEKFPGVPQGVQEENGIKWKVEVYAKQEREEKEEL